MKNRNIRKIKGEYDVAVKEYKINRLGTDVLYHLCDESGELSGHENKQRVRAKIWLIGRAYAATLERGNIGRQGNREALYKKVIEKYSSNKELQRRFKEFERKKYNAFNEDDVPRIIEICKFLAEDIFKVEERKYSLASKYLHFHFPRAFFIYDTFSNEGVTCLCKQLKGVKRLKGEFKTKNVYEEYLNKCIYVTKELKAKDRIKFERPTPYKTRNLDILLQHIGKKVKDFKKKK